MNKICNKIVLFLFLIVPFIGSGQLEGTYCKSYGVFGGKCITFLDSNKFVYSSSSCTYRHSGRGIYKKSFRNLTLHFDSSYKDENKKIVINTEDTNSNKIKISLNVTNEKGENLYFANVTLEDSNNKLIQGQSADLYGNASFVVNKGKDSISLNISYVGFYKVQHYFVPNKNYTIKLVLKDMFDKVFNNGEIIKYKIKRLPNPFGFKNSLTLKEMNGFSSWQRLIKEKPKLENNQE